MKRSKAIIGLSLLALFFILTTSLASGQPARDPQWRPGFLAGEFLNLTPEQRAKLEEFRKARQEERKTFSEKMEKFRADLRELMKDPQANEKKIHGLIDEMFKLRAAEMKNSIKHREEMKKIFTPEQLEKIKNLRGRMARFIGRRMGGFKPGPCWGAGWGERPFWGRTRFSRPFSRWWRW